MALPSPLKCWVLAPDYVNDRGTALFNAWWGKDVEGIPLHPISEATELEEGSESAAHTSLDLKELGGRLYFSDDNMLLRKEYLIARDFLIERAGERGKTGVVVSGQSGIGKTYFLWYLLRYRLSKKLPTVFGVGSFICFFCEAGAFYPLIRERGFRGLVHEVAKVFESQKPWSLFDTGLNTEGPDRDLWDGDVFVVCTSDPDRSKYKSLLKHKHAQIYTMNPWSWSELIAGWSLQHDNSCAAELDVPRLRQMYDKYGPVPRTVYGAYQDGVCNWFDDLREYTLEKISCFRDLRLLTGYIYDSSSEVCEQAETISCLRRKNGESGFRPCTDVLSPYVMSAILQLPAFADAEAKIQVTKYFMQKPDSDYS